MQNSPFTLRSDTDLLATFRSEDQEKVVLPRFSVFPFMVPFYYAWTDPSGVYTYLVYKRADWETPLGLVFQRNGAGSHLSPAGMCDWCHAIGASDEIGLLTTTVNPHLSGGTWLCLDLSCIEKIEARGKVNPKNLEKRIHRLCDKIGDFYEFTRVNQ